MKSTLFVCLTPFVPVHILDEENRQKVGALLSFSISFAFDRCVFLHYNRTKHRLIKEIVFMKMSKRIAAFFLLIALCFTLAACKQKNEGTIIGQWSVNVDGILQMTGLTQEQYDQFKEKGIEQTVIMDFNNEGIVAITMSVAGQYVKDFQPYEVKDGKLIIAGDPADYNIAKNTMTITQDDLKMTLTKVDAGK